MKKINVLMLGVLVLFAGFFASCKKDAATNDATISLAGDVGYTATDATVTGGGSFKIKWTATSSTDMGFITIAQDNVAYVGWNEKEIASGSKSTYIDEATIKVPASGGPYTYSIIIYGTGTNGTELARKDIVITIGTTTATVSILSTSLGSATWNTTDGSFYSIGTQLVYKYDATGAAANVDFGYMYGDAGGSNLATIFSPEWASAQTLTQKITSPSKATKFVVTTLSASEFDAITETGNAIITSAVTSATAQYVNNLQVGGANAGKIIGFVLQNTKKGLIKFGTVTNGSNATYPQGSGTATFTIKVIN